MLWFAIKAIVVIFPVKADPFSPAMAFSCLGSEFIRLWL